MLNRLGWSIVLFLFFANLAEAGGRYNNHKYGFSIVAPDKWPRIPTQPDEKWVVARFKSKRSYPCADGWTDHTPTMKVILFMKEKEKTTGSLDKKEGEKEKPKITITFTNPYKDYKDYLKKNFYGGGYYISSEKQGKQGGTPVTRLEIKVEKLARYGKQRIITWIFHAPLGDFAVQTDVLEDKYVKLAPAIFNALKSFRIIKRKLGEAEAEGQVDSPVVIEVGKETTPEDRKKERIEFTKKAFKKAKRDLPPGWKTMETKHFLVIYHTPTSKAVRFANQAQVLRTWLEKHFDRIGDEHVSRCILRICKNEEEERAYSSSSSFGGGWSFSNREIVTNVSSFDRKWEFRKINRSVLNRFLGDKNPELSWSLPYWLDTGFDQYFATAMAKGKRLVFAPDSDEKVSLRQGRKQGKLLPIKELMLSTREDTGKGWEDWEMFQAQCGSVVRFLFGPGNRGKTKDILFTYMGNILSILEEKEKAAAKKREEEKKKGEKKGPKTEEEEEEDFKKKKAAGSSKEWLLRKREMLNETMKRTFDTWSSRDWKMLDRAWNASFK
jgi:hypothetical protein